MRHLFYTLFIYTIFFTPALAGDKNASLRALERNCEKARSLSQYSSLEKVSEKLINQSKCARNNRSLTYGYFYNGLSKLFLGKNEESIKILDIADSLSSHNNNDSVKALTLNAKGIYHAIVQNNNFVAQQYFFKSLELAKKCRHLQLYYRIRGNLLTLSHGVGNSLALKNATEVYNYGVKTNNFEQISMGAFHLATYYFRHKKYHECEKYLRIALETYKHYPYEDIASVYALYAKMLIVRNELNEAEKMVLKSIEAAQRYNIAPLEVDADITYAEVYNKKGKYAESIDMIKKAMEKANRIGMSNKVIDCNQLIADNYSALGKTTEAMKYLRKVNSLLASQATINMERLSHEQQVMYDIEKKDMDAKIKQEQISSQRLTMIMLAVAIIILLTLLTFIIISYRRRQTLYRKIVTQNSNAIRRQMELEQQIEKLTQKLNSIPSNTPQDEAQNEKEPFIMDEDKLESIYSKLCQMMETERLFTQPQLTREKMAEYLGTNRTYLTKVIKEKTNMSYLQFINSYRINEAIRILSDKNKESYPLKQIWSDLGFSSPSTFFKQFQQTVGITPSIYRKQILEVNNQDCEADEDNLL